MSIDAIKNCLNRKYKLDKASSENFDEYMKALGISYPLRKIGNNVSPIVELTQEADGKLTLSSKSTFKNVSMTFNLGEEFIEVTPDGREVKSIINIENNNLIQKQRNGKETLTIREFTPESMKITLKIDDVVCTRTYNYVQE